MLTKQNHAIRWIAIHQLSGYRYPAFEQLGRDVYTTYLCTIKDVFGIFTRKKKRMALSTRLRTAGDTRSSNSLVRSKARGKVPRLEIE